MTSLQDFVVSLTDQMNKSNQIIKSLSVSMYEIISFYKELIIAQKEVNNQSNSELPIEEFFTILSKAQGLVEKINFDTEHIDLIVGENDELLQKKV